MSKALSQAAKLKPEIRLAQALSEFCGSLAEPRAREFKTLQTTSPPTPADVIRLMEEINRDGARNHKAWRPYATSMALFLERVQTLSRIGDFLVGSSQNMTASGIWAAIKITLGVAVGSLTFFKRISELFLNVGRSSSITRDIVEVYPTSKELQQLMCEYLITLVSFCQKVVVALEKPTMVQLVSPFIGFFDKESAKFEAELSYWASAIDRTAMVLLSQRQLEAADTVSRIGRTLSKQPERSAAWRRQRRKGTSQWLFEQKAYQAWETSSVSSVLWIKGKLGSGKSVLLANIVANLYDTRRTLARRIKRLSHDIIAYYFCDKERSDTNTYEIMMGSLVQQILSFLAPDHKTLALLDQYFGRLNTDHETLALLDEYFGRLNHAPLGDDVLTILDNTLPRDRPIFVILDGLDECSKKTVSAVLAALKSISNVRRVHICCSTRTGTMLRGVLISVFPHIDHDITLSSETISSDLKTYVEAEIERRRHIRQLDPSLEAIVKDVLVKASDGMFLWTVLQIDALFPLHPSTLLSSADVLHALENLPKNLADAFDRTLGRITDTRYGNRIFKLVAAARRPLTLSELRIALHVKPGDREWDALTLPQDPGAIIALCTGNLLEVDEEDDTVRFIHHSVYGHLITPEPSDYGFRFSDADVYMGSVCVTYLNYSIFDTALTTTSNLVLPADKLTKDITTTLVSGQDSVAARIVAAITHRRSSRKAAVDIGQLLHQYLKPSVDTNELLEFSAYAHEHWLWHTTRLWTDRTFERNYEVYILFESMFCRTPEHVAVPWTRNVLGTVEEWAIANRHFGLLLGSLTSSKNPRDRHVADAITATLEYTPSQVEQLSITIGYVPSRAADILDEEPDVMFRGLIVLTLELGFRSFDTQIRVEGLIVKQRLEEIRDSVTGNKSMSGHVAHAVASREGGP